MHLIVEVRPHLIVQTDQELWNIFLYFQDENKKQKVLSASIDMTDICYYQLVQMVESVGFSAIHFLYYKKKNLRGRGHLVHIDNDSHVRKMISEHKNEKRVNFYVFKEKATVDVAPLEPQRDDENGSTEVHRTYNVTVRVVEVSAETYDANSSFMQGSVEKGSIVATRMESIAAYAKHHGQHKSGSEKQSDTNVSANDMCTLDEWPSHARRNRPQLQNEGNGKKKNGRGVLKGLKPNKKRFANGSAKLNIAFSENLGGTIGMNYRSFKDDVVILMKRNLPLIGVRRWSDIHTSIHRLIVVAMLDRWELEDTPETEDKILKIAKERYRGWRSTLSSTYKAYKTDAARMANVPEDLQPEEWEWMIKYFGTDSKFQEISQKNSNNRKKQKTQHKIGSKSYSQLSFEKRNLETGEEPDCIALWELTHTKNGTWSNSSPRMFMIKHLKRFKTKKRKLMVQFQVKIETIFSRPHIKTLCSASHRSLVGTDTWPNHQVVLKGSSPSLKSKLVLQQRPKR